MLDAWLSLEQFLVQCGKLPSRLEDIDAATLAGFAERQSSECINVEQFLMMLAGIRMILLVSGCAIEQLAAIERARKATTTRQRYERQLPLREGTRRGGAITHGEPPSLASINR